MDPLESFSVKIEHPHYVRDVIVARRDSIRHVLLLTDVCLGFHLSFDGVRLSEDSDIISVGIPPNSMPAGLCLSRLASLKMTSSSYTNTMSVLSSVKQIAHVAVLVRSHEAIIKFTPWTSNCLYRWPKDPYLIALDLADGWHHGRRDLRIGQVLFPYTKSGLLKMYHTDLNKRISRGFIFSFN